MAWDLLGVSTGKTGVTGIIAEFVVAGVDGTETRDKGVAARGTKVELRPGVNGAEVGTILDTGLEIGSSRVIGGGCA